MSSSAAPAVAVTSMTPIAAASKKATKRGKWKPVEIGEGMICVSGGFSRTPSNANSIKIMNSISNTMEVFVQLEKNGHWFLKGVGGPGTQKGDLKSVHVMNDIRVQFDEVCAGIQDLHSAVAAEEDESQDEELDPMDALDDVQLAEPAALAKLNTGRRTIRKQKRSLRSTIQQLDMPTRPACAGREQDGTTMIHVYRKAGTSARNFGNLFLRLDALDWLLSYGADELHFQGVMRPEPAPAAPKGNCPAVADLHLAWDFGDKAWDAEFVSGEHAGTKRRFFVADLTRDRWNRMKRSEIVEVDVQIANRLVKKNAAKHFITIWCEAIKSNEGPRFEQEWGLLEPIAATPAKKRRDANSPAVADKAGTPL
jgi:hypothetical protein